MTKSAREALIILRFLAEGLETLLSVLFLGNGTSQFRSPHL